MIIDVECPRCGGQSWVAERKVLIGTRSGVYESDCPECNGAGCVQYNPNDEIDDWMED